jgi:hypothetical protein
VKQRTPHIVNWVLIALLIMLPLRGVIALERIDCGMQAAEAASVHDHSMHMKHGVSDQVQPLTTEKHACCCCDVGTSCSNDCAAGLGVSLIMQSSVVLPERNRPVYRSLIGNKPVIRDPSPPLRPPASVRI